MPRCEYISQAEFARRLGVSRAAVSKALKEKRIKLSKNKKLEWKSQGQRWKESETPKMDMKGESDSKDDKSLEDYKANRAKKADYDARLKELEFKEKKGLLIRKTLVSKVLSESFLLVRNTIIELPDQLEAQISAIWMDSIKSFLEVNLPDLEDEIKKQIIEIPCPELAREALKGAGEEVLKKLQESLDNGL